jgi:geranylgeranyl diphosphate synthase, type II
MDLISDYQNIVEEKIKDLQLVKSPRALYEPIEYILELGGKRIRPALCLAACHYFSGSHNSAMQAALGLEMFHNFTLLHDDIMDQSSIRRNQPTVHKKWNANTAILSGDAMMIKASQLMLQVPANVLTEIQELFLKTALEVCEGQQFDMDFETRDDVQIDEYLEMIRLKTAVLLAASLKIGAIIGGATKKNADLIYNFGETIGLAFQLQDDYLDAYGNSETFGKKVGQDIIANKKTFLLISCLKTADASQFKIVNNWLKKPSFDPIEKVEAIKNIYNQLEIEKMSREKMNDYYNQSLQTLEQIDIDTKYQLELKEFAMKLMNRTN